jgi:hypothetical protein
MSPFCLLKPAMGFFDELVSTAFRDRKPISFTTFLDKAGLAMALCSNFVRAVFPVFFGRQCGFAEKP